MMVSLILCVLLLIAAAGFGYWAYGERQDYKNHSDAKAAVAVKEAEAAQRIKLEAEFAEREKNPYKSYTGPSAYGSISFNYPKTWSFYLVEANTQQPILGYFKPNFVPAVGDSKAVYALRMELMSTAYEQELTRFDSIIKQGKLKSVAFLPPKLKDKNVLPGVRLDGELQLTKPGSAVIIKVRDKTLKLTTDGKDFEPDFTNIVLSSLSFTP